MIASGGKATSDIVNRACGAFGYSPVCDDTTTANYRCATVGQGAFHWSDKASTDAVPALRAVSSVLNGAVYVNMKAKNYVVSRDASGARDMTNDVKGSNMPGQRRAVLCARRQDDINKPVFFSESHALYRVPLDNKSGEFKNADLVSTCAALGKKPVCASYNDDTKSNGECVVVAQSKSLQHASHNTGLNSDGKGRALFQSAIMYNTIYSGKGLFHRAWDNSYHGMTSTYFNSWPVSYAQQPYSTICT